MLFVRVLRNLVRQPLRALVLRILAIQLKLMAMSKMMLPAQQNFVLKNDLLLQRLYRMIHLVHEKWDGMVQHG